MHKIILFMICTGSYFMVNGQLSTANNGLSYLGSNVYLGGTLNNGPISIDFGSSFSNSNFLFKKGSSNYFFIGNNGNIGIGTTSPNFQFSIPSTGWKIGTGSQQLLYVPDQTNFAGSFIIGDGGGNLSNAGGGSFGQGNLFFGKGAGYSNTTAYTNIAIGQNALYSNLTQSAVVAIGAHALKNSTAANESVAIGIQAGYLNTTGAYLTYLGAYAGYNNSVGNYNTGVGSRAMYSNTTGQFNTAVGLQALHNNQTGTDNTAIGNRVAPGFGASTGSFSYGTFVGSEAGYKIEAGANNNTFIGYAAGREVTTGTSNAIVGYQAGNNITTGSKNIVIGFDIDAPVATSDGQLSIGNLIYANGINGTGTTVSTGNVGIGINNPAYKLDVSGTGGYPARFRDGGYWASHIQVENSNGYYANFGVEGGGIVSLKSNNTTFLYGNSSGKVGIGTTNLADNNYKLFVETGIRTRKIKVDQATWPDYVFHQTYELMPLGEVETFIQQHNHLPAVPSAKQIEENGLDLGDNQSILLKKIEELTLYIIEQNKKIEHLQKKVDSIIANKN